MKIGLVSDHAGFVEKTKIMLILNKLSKEDNKLGQIQYEDYGPHTLNPGDDYPDFAKLLADKIIQTECDRGIAVCGTGIGMSMDLNKIPGIRAALCYSEDAARKAASHNNANVICLRGDMDEERVGKIIKTWLETSFDTSGDNIRHLRRIKKMEKAEGQYLWQRAKIRVKSLLF